MGGATDQGQGGGMVCSDCEKKAAFTDRSVICPDPWKDGSRNSVSGKDAGRKLNENKLLSKKRGNNVNPYDVKCQVCKQRLHDGNGLYCQDCAYAKGLCRLCGKVVLKGREFYKSFYSEENEKKFAPKRDPNEAIPEDEHGNKRPLEEVDGHIVDGGEKKK